MFLLKNRNVSKLSGANCHAKLSHSKQLLKNIHPRTIDGICCRRLSDCPSVRLSVTRRGIVQKRLNV